MKRFCAKKKSSTDPKWETIQNGKIENTHVHQEIGDRKSKPFSSTSRRVSGAGMTASVRFYFSIGRPKHSTYPLLSMISKALSPSPVLASSLCMGTCLPVNSLYSVSGLSV
jgi:hypothetical protein